MKVSSIKGAYPKGTRVQLDYINDNYTELKKGDCGTVENVDDMGQIHVKWDCGVSLALILGEDKFNLILE